jgi:hypothetical protein
VKIIIQQSLFDESLPILLSFIYFKHPKREYQLFSILAVLNLVKPFALLHNIFYHLS